MTGGSIVSFFVRSLEHVMQCLMELPYGVWLWQNSSKAVFPEVADSLAVGITAGGNGPDLGIKGNDMPKSFFSSHTSWYREIH
jgi:hypothetical protein